MTGQTLEQCLLEQGYTVPAYQVGRLVRFNMADKPPRKKTAWLKVFDNGNAVFGDWATGEQHTYSPTGERLTKAEYIKLRREQEKERERYQMERDKGYKETALVAQSIIDGAKPAPSNHPYLIAKGIQPHSALLANMQSYSNALIIPVCGTFSPFLNRLQSIQFILPDGSKRFLSGGKMKGGYCIIQQIKDAPVVICEGFSTGATLAEHYCKDSTVICAFNAGNLHHVARRLRQSSPFKKITIAGDNDHKNKTNAGATSANAAALAIGGVVSLPTFADDEIGSDWNDRYRLDNDKKGARNER